MKPRLAHKICLGTVTLALAAGSSIWTLRSGQVSPVKPPALQPASFKTVELPRVTVRYARFDEAYAVALGRILQEALEPQVRWPGS